MNEQVILFPEQKSKMMNFKIEKRGRTPSFFFRQMFKGHRCELDMSLYGCRVCGLSPPPSFSIIFFSSPSPFLLPPQYFLLSPPSLALFSPSILLSLSSNALPTPYPFCFCPNKHGNSVTNSISSFQIIL